MIKKIVSVLICIIFLSNFMGNNSVIFAENESNVVDTYEIALSEKMWVEAYQEEWNYPISPDMEEWKDLSYKQALAVCNMPQNLLETISTQELVQLALKYPFLVDMYLYDSIEKGLKYLCLKSNIINELYNRDDVGTYLL